MTLSLIMRRALVIWRAAWIFSSRFKYTAMVIIIGTVIIRIDNIAKNGIEIERLFTGLWIIAVTYFIAVPVCMMVVVGCFTYFDAGRLQRFMNAESDNDFARMESELRKVFKIE